MTELVALQAIPGTIQIVPGQTFRELDPERAAQWLRTGLAKVPDMPNSRGWNGLRWDGATVAILASGESLSAEQCAAVKAWRDRDPILRKAIAINTSFRRAPWADVIYACDSQWWNAVDKGHVLTHIEEARAECLGELWTQDDEAARKHGVKLIRSDRGKGLSRVPGRINQGMSSGYQAIGLAWQAGAVAALLLGYDNRGGHWHGAHPKGLEKTNPYATWAKNLGELAADCKGAGFAVTNCTPGSALKMFHVEPWQEVFA